MGKDPLLVEPDSERIPSVGLADPIGWKAGEQPVAPAGLAVGRFAEGLDHPRTLLALPNGDILVAETNSPPRDMSGIGGFFMKLFMGRVGAGGPSPDKIILLRDSDGDGKAEGRFVFREKDLASPSGMAWRDGKLYVANHNAVLAFEFVPGATVLGGTAKKLMDLPGGGNHWMRNLLLSPDGKKLYVAVGSASNIGENGMAEEAGRAAIWEIDLASGSRRQYAAGLRNPNGMAWNPSTGELWTVVNERDEIGNSLVPDYLTAVREGAFYGWPYSYWGGHVDERVSPPRPDMVARAIRPDYALGSHVAPLGLAWTDRSAMPSRFQQGMFVGLHGSWNRRPRDGYAVIFVPFVDGRPQGMPVGVLEGFVDDDGNARGRPVGVAMDGRGALLVADDVGNTVWRVVSAPETSIGAPAAAAP